MERQELGAALRRLRESTDPASVGLTAVDLPGGTRRVRGLRREELGDLAGLSADYVRRLEQGRSHPSAAVVRAIARALKVGRGEYEHLSALAGHAAADGVVPADLGPGATRLLERFADTPVIVSDAATNLVAVNRAFTALEHWQPTGHRFDHNLAWRAFVEPFDAFKQSEADAFDHEAVLVTQLRTSVLRYPADSALAELVDELRTRSRVFDAAWRHPRAVAAFESSATITQSDGGSVDLVGNLVAVPGDDLAAVLLTAAPGSPDETRLAELVGAASGPSVVRVPQPA